MSGRGAYFVKVFIALALIIGALVAITPTVEATEARFGALGWIHWMLGLLSTAAGAIAVGAATVGWHDRRNLRRYRAVPTDGFEDGQVVALSGTLEVDGEPLVAPFSGTPCAAYRYQVTGQRRSGSASGSNRRSQLCLLGHHLAHARLETGTRSFRLLAVPDVDADLRETALGGDWGERGQAMIEALRGERRTPEPDAAGRASEVRRHAEPPLAVDLFVAAGTQASSSLSIVEDTLPVGESITLLGTFVVGDRGLDGRRPGGMKAFPGALDERLRGLARENRIALTAGIPLLVAGIALMTLAQWWPG